jgi:DNA primase
MAVAKQYLKKVRRSGSENIMSLCPFHLKADGTQEQHPSFAMSLTNGLYFCHSCKEKGTFRLFLQNIGLTKQDIELKYELLINAVSKNIRAKLDPLNPNIVSLNPLPESILGIFDFVPKSLLNDGFEERTLRHFDVGFDTHHMRITYPIRDIEGNLVAISGRNVTDAWPRYKVYDKEYTCWELPERLGWDKRTALYNAHNVYPHVYFLPSAAEVVVVEGFKACMWLWQAGITNTVGLLGSYMSWEQQWLLEKMGATVYLFLDNNTPGILGVIETGKKLAKSLPVKVMVYPPRLKISEDAQPDNLTPEELNESKNEAIDYFKWRTQR